MINQLDLTHICRIPDTTKIEYKIFPNTYEIFLMLYNMTDHTDMLNKF